MIPILKKLSVITVGCIVLLLMAQQLNPDSEVKLWEKKGEHCNVRTR